MRYTPGQNYRMLTEIYRGALERRHGTAAVSAAAAMLPAPKGA